MFAYLHDINIPRQGVLRKPIATKLERVKLRMFSGKGSRIVQRLRYNQIPEKHGVWPPLATQTGLVVQQALAPHHKKH